MIWFRAIHQGCPAYPGRGVLGNPDIYCYVYQTHRGGGSKNPDDLVLDRWPLSRTEGADRSFTKVKEVGEGRFLKVK